MQIRQLKRLLDAGQIGRPFRARIDMISGFPVLANQPFLKDLEQFIITDMGSHTLDVTRLLVGAGWTAGSLKYLCESGAASLTYYETSGWSGVIEQERGSPLPNRFRSLPGGVFPLYHVLADVGEFTGGEALPAVSSAPLRVEGLVLRKGTATRKVLASLIPTRQRVRIQHGGRHTRVRLLDERNAEAAMRDPAAFRAQAGELLDTPDGSIALELLQYAIARVDLSTA